MEVAHNLFKWTGKCRVTPFDVSRMGYPYMELVCNAIWIASGEVKVQIRDAGNGEPELLLDSRPYQRTQQLYSRMEEEEEFEESGGEWEEKWFLDPEPVEWSFRADYIFAGFNEVWDMLLDKQKYYVGKLNAYDVDNMVREAIMECCLMAGDLLRFYFRDVEEMPEFIAAKKQAVWQIYWGEYRGESVLVAQADREPKTENQWLMAVRDDKEGSELKESYWYQAELSQGNCEKKDLSFAVFEDCVLKKLMFKEAILAGARFKNCRIENCDLEGADCRMAYFEHCTWIEPELKGANMEHTIFTEDGIPAEWLDETQTAEVLIKEEV